MPETQPSNARFGPFHLDLRAGELHRNGNCVLLQEQALQVLLLLLQHDGEIVTRKEIKKKLWPNDTIVEFDHSINTAIKKLRRALDDSADGPQYIETIARRGYRLMVPVEWISSNIEVPGNGSENSADPGLPLPVPPEPARDEPLVEKLRLGALTGKVVSHYRVLDIIGGGGGGLVYRAEDLKLGRAVALKFLPEDIAGEVKMLDRFEREAHALSALDHPNICTVYELGEHEGHPFIAMQLLKGQTLREWLGSSSRADKVVVLQQVLELAAQIAAGMESAHEKGIIHRDIKPANIFITYKGEAKILDFGVAKVLQSAEEKGNADTGPTRAQGTQSTRAAATDVTRTGLKLGTPRYMSPEQVRGEVLDARTDIFSFGLVLYEMVTGERAFVGDTEGIMHDAIQHRAPKPIHDAAPEISPDVELIILKCLQKDRNQRYQSSTELRAALLSVQRASGVEDPKKAHDFGQRQWVLISLIAATLVLCVIGARYWRSHRLTKLTDKDTIVLADFVNTTGDPVFDGTLKQALAIELEQSPFLNVFSEKQVNDILKLMKHPSTERLTLTTAQEVCTRANGRAVLQGSIAAIESRYQVSLEAVDCHSGDTLAHAESVASNRNGVVTAVGKATKQLREKLGESLSSVQKFDRPLEEATTSSLEALQAYTLGRRKQAEQGEAAAIPYFKLAIDLDPQFAYGYVALSTSEFGLYQFVDASANLEKAFALREKVTQRERFAIEGYYYDWVTGDLEKVKTTHAEWTKTYPRDYIPHVRLSAYYRTVGQLDKAVSEAETAVKLAPDNTVAAFYLMTAEIRSNRFDLAKAVCDEAERRNLTSPMLHRGRYLIAFFQGDEKRMRELVDSAADIPMARDLLLQDDSVTQAYRGKVKLAREVSSRSADLATSSGAPERAAVWKAYQAEWELEMGNRDRAMQALSAALQSSSMSQDVRTTAAYVLARLGKLTQAKQMIDKVASERPLDTVVQYQSVPMVRAATAMSQNKPDLAIEFLRVTVPYELTGLGQAYLRGLAYLEARQPRPAAAEFQKLLDHPGVVENSPLGALARLQLGRTHALAGDMAAASRFYNEFLTLWKDADPDIPIYRQAKAEYARLR